MCRHGIFRIGELGFIQDEATTQPVKPTDILDLPRLYWPNANLRPDGPPIISIDAFFPPASVAVSLSIETALIPDPNAPQL